MIDYRKIPKSINKVFFDPINHENKREFGKLFEALTDLEPVHYNQPIKVWGRDLIIPESTSQVARFSFESLCGQPLSAADYLEITKKFEIVFVTDIPRLTMFERDMASELFDPVEFFSHRSAGTKIHRLHRLLL
jgi:peroxisome-assembly ATPase